jgi:flagellar protein FliO/FliZ
MFIADIARMAAALAVTLGLIGVAVVALRRYGPDTLRKLQGAHGQRRLSVIESLTLDPSRRLVLVRFDAEEKLLLLGEGQVLAARPAAASEDAR